MQRLAVQKYFFENFDTIACISGILFGILIASLYLISKTIFLLMLGGALTFASLVYLLIKNRKTLSYTPISSSIKIIFEIIFFFLFSMSLWILYINENRPFLYFVLISLSVSFLALSIISIKSKIDPIVQIVKIFLISFNLKYSLFVSFSGTGIDYWIHLAANNNLARSGLIAKLPDKESFFPMMHIQVAIHQIVTNFPIKDATNFAIIIPLVISSICVFLVARKIFDVRIALLAMLIINITDFLTWWGLAPQTTSFGICLFYFLILIIFQIVSTKNRMSWYIILLIFIPVLIFAHAISSFIFLIAIGGLFVGSYAYKNFYDNHAAIFPSITIIILYGIILIQHWFGSTFNEMSEKSFFDVIVSTLAYYMTEHAGFLNRPETIAVFSYTLPPLIERAADKLGLSILMFLAALGCLFWLSKKYRNRVTFSIFTCTILLLFITFGFPLFGIRNIIPSRWFAFMYFFLSIMAACGVFFLLTRIHSQKMRTLLFVIIIASLTFFLTTSTISNTDSPLWLKESTVSLSYSIQELKGAETLTRYSDSVFSDSRFGFVIDYYYQIHTESRGSSDLSQKGGEIFVWREYMFERPISSYVNVVGYYKTIESPVVLGQDYLKRLEMMQKVYTNGEILGYLVQNVN